MGSLLPAFRCTLKASVLWWVSARLRCAELAGGSQGWGREGRRTRAQGGVPLWVCVYVCTCHGWLWINLYMWVCKCDACMSLHSLLICVNALGTGEQVFRSPPSPIHPTLLIPEGVPPPASPLKPVLTLQLTLSSPCPLPADPAALTCWHTLPTLFILFWFRLGAWSPLLSGGEADSCQITPKSSLGQGILPCPVHTPDLN